jgi:hypothetical protein
MCVLRAWPAGALHQGGLGVPSQGNLLDWADKALGQGISSVTRGVKNLLSGARQAPVAAALEALMEGKQVRPRCRCPRHLHGPGGGGHGVSWRVSSVQVSSVRVL